MAGREAASRFAREALVEASRGLRRRQTRSEAILWAALRDRRLRGYKFRRQHRIGNYIVDFYCAEARLVVEVDGPIHAHQQDEDRARQAVLENEGLSVLRVSAEDVEQSLQEVVAHIVQQIESSDAIASATSSHEKRPSPSPARERGRG